jgi:hypothetical protein
MFGTRCLRSTSRSAPLLDTPLREATRIARSVSYLGSSRTPASSPLPVAATRDINSRLPSNAAAGLPDTPPIPSNPSNSFDKLWLTAQSRQRLLFAHAHVPAEDRYPAVTMACVNTVHIEGVVTAVQCGHLATHVPGPLGQAPPGYRTVCVKTPLNLSYPTVLLWLEVDATASTTSSSSSSSPSLCLLAVRCRLSPEVVERLWQAQQHVPEDHQRHDSAATATTTTPTRDDGEGGDMPRVATRRSSSFSKKALSDAKLRCVKKWVAESLLNYRVIVSGQLRMEEVYDGDLDKVVSVPVIELPQDELIGRVIALEPA